MDVEPGWNVDRQLTMEYGGLFVGSLRLFSSIGYKNATRWGTDATNGPQPLPNPDNCLILRHN